jgi:4-hydroxyacetophenone monooxygenase
MSKRPELLAATDATIEDAVKFADPMVLRGLVYQLTGDESIATTKLTRAPLGNVEANLLTDQAEIDLIRAKAAAFLKQYRDSGAKEIPCGPRERLHRSLNLTAGADLPDCEMGLWLEQLALDPWARGIHWLAPPPAKKLEEFTVAVIGAGMGGLNAAVLMKQAGVRYFVIEKNPEVGGTWFENHYPGARVDSTSRTYTHIYGVDYVYPYAFCPRSENLKYFQWMADHFDLRKDITFNTEIASVIWDESAKMWELRGNGPDGPRVWRANAVIASVGFLSRPQMPTIEGMETFRGPSFHTARWPDDLDLTGKRVAVIGTGATGYQMVPELAKLAGHTYVFQRTANWCYDVPNYLAPFPPQVTWLDRNFPYIMNFIRFRLAWISGPDHGKQTIRIDPDFKDPHARSARNKKMRDARVAFISRKLAGRPELIPKMIPEAPCHSARPIIVDSNYSIYDALLRDDVTLMSDGIEKITPTGIRTGGVDLPIDVIVYATGYKASDYLWPMEVRGRGGKHVDELWAKDGARAYLGSMLPGFPNFFMIYGPNTNNFGVGLQIVDSEEIVTRFILECIGGLISQNKQTVDVKTDAYWHFNDEVDRNEATMMYKDPRARNYYTNKFGRSATNMPIDLRKMWTWLRDPAQNWPKNGDAEALAHKSIRPYFGEDLVVE